MTINWKRNDDGTGTVTITDRPIVPVTGSPVRYTLVEQGPIFLCDHLGCLEDAADGSHYCTDHQYEDDELVDPDWAYDLMIERRMGL